VREHCRAFALGLQEQIPIRRATRTTPLIRRVTFCISRQRNGTREWLIEQRPARGRWASMWQFVTVPTCETAKRRPSASQVLRHTNIRSSAPKSLAVIEHGLTHRRYRFDVYECETSDGENIPRDRPCTWIELQSIEDYPLPRPHLRIAEMLRERRTNPSAS
jgi:A/G-specific adenine glycosylase